MSWVVFTNRRNTLGAGPAILQFTIYRNTRRVRLGPCWGRCCNIAIRQSRLRDQPARERVIWTTLWVPVLQYCNSAISPPGSTARVRATGMSHRLTKRNSSGALRIAILQDRHQKRGSRTGIPNCTIAGLAQAWSRLFRIAKLQDRPFSVRCNTLWGRSCNIAIRQSRNGKTDASTRDWYDPQVN
jgi:hypothetical protein